MRERGPRVALSLTLPITFYLDVSCIFRDNVNVRYVTAGTNGQSYLMDYQSGCLVCSFTS